MNEEDKTFDALRRTPIKRLQRLMQDDANGQFESAIYHPFSDYEIVFLLRHGWTPIEFKRAWRDQVLEEHPEQVIHAKWWPSFIQSLE